jgi:nitrogen regulatory protein PII
MSNEGITYLTDAVLVTAVVRAGRADAVLIAARDMGASGGIVHLARGTGVRERLGLLGIAVDAEKDVVSIVVAAEHQDLIARAIYQAAEMREPGGGYLYLTPIEKLATFIPQEALDRVGKPG